MCPVWSIDFGDWKPNNPISFIALHSSIGILLANQEGGQKKAKNWEENACIFYKASIVEWVFTERRLKRNEKGLSQRKYHQNKDDR